MSHALINLSCFHIHVPFIETKQSNKYPIKIKPSHTRIGLYTIKVFHKFFIFYFLGVHKKRKQKILKIYATIDLSIFQNTHTHAHIYLSDNKETTNQNN